MERPRAGSPPRCWQLSQGSLRPGGAFEPQHQIQATALPRPSLLALGATWDEELVHEASNGALVALQRLVSAAFFDQATVQEICRWPARLALGSALSVVLAGGASMRNMSDDVGARCRISRQGSERGVRSPALSPQPQ